MLLVASKSIERVASTYWPVPAPGGQPAAGIPATRLVPTVLLSFCAAILLMAHAGLSIRIEPRLLALFAAYIVVMGLIVVWPRLAWSIPARTCADGIEYLTLFGGISLFGALASYPVAAASTGFFDSRVARLDRALGFDWLSWYELVARHPLLQLGERTAYQAIFLMPAIILGYFAVTCRRAEAMRFITRFWLAAILTLAAFYLMPTRGPLAFLVGGDLPYLPVSALYQAQIIPQLRAHQLHLVDLTALRGLVGAPSFHATSGVLFIAAAWPGRALRWPIAVFSAAMLLATPIEGTHYLVDILAGALVALIAIAATHAIERRCPATDKS